jgi:hypothetical protein
MNIAGYGHFATSVSAVSPARDSLRSVSAESQLGTESPVVPVTKLPSTSTSTTASTGGLSLYARKAQRISPRRPRHKSAWFCYRLPS